MYLLFVSNCLSSSALILSLDLPLDFHEDQNLHRRAVLHVETFYYVRTDQNRIAFSSVATQCCTYVCNVEWLPRKFELIQYAKNLGITWRSKGSELIYFRTSIISADD